MNGFSHITVWVIHGIHKPDTIIFRKDIDHRRINVKWHLILKKIAKLAFLIQETWHMIGYFLYPKGLSETPRSGNTSAIAPHRNTAFFPICRYNSC